MATFMIPCDSISSDRKIVTFSNNVKKFLAEASSLFTSWGISDKLFYSEYGYYSLHAKKINSITYRDSTDSLVKVQLQIKQYPDNYYFVQRDCLKYGGEASYGNFGGYQVYALSYIPTSDSDGADDTENHYSIRNLLAQNTSNPYLQIEFDEELTQTNGHYAFIVANVNYKALSVSNVNYYRDYANGKVTFAIACSAGVSELSLEVNGYSSKFAPNVAVANGSITVSEAYFKITGALTTNLVTIKATNYGKTVTYTLNVPFYKTWPEIDKSEIEIITTDDYIDYPIALEFTGSYFTKYEIYANGNIAASGATNSATTTTTIRANLDRSKLKVGEGGASYSNIIYIKLYNILSDEMYGTTSRVKNMMDNSDTIKLSLKTIKPTISDVTIDNVGNLIDNETTVSWSSSNQSRINFYYKGKLISSIAGGGTVQVFAPGTFDVKIDGVTSMLTVEAVKDAITINGVTVENTRLVAVATKSISFTRLYPTITGNSFSISSTNIDHDINAIWEAINFEHVQILQDNILKHEAHTTEQSLIIPAGRLTTYEKTSTTSKIILRLWHHTSFDAGCYKDIELPEQALTADWPVIGYLEPSGSRIRVDMGVTVTFEMSSAGRFCDSWELIAADSKVIGTTQREANFGGGRFLNGPNSMTINIYYTPKWNGATVRKSSKTVIFTGYGKPNSPVLHAEEMYSDATPKFSWDFAEVQKSYTITVTNLDTDEIVETYSNVSGTLFDYEVQTDLEDGTNYRVSLTVVSSNDIASDTVSADFITNFSPSTVPNLTLSKDDSCVYIAVSGHQDADFASNEILRSEDGGETWITIATNLNTIDSITDSFARCNCKLQYKVKTYNREGAYTMGNVQSITLEMKDYNFTDVENPMITKTLKFISSPKQITTNVKQTVKLYAGMKRPRVFFGKCNYKSIVISAYVVESKVGSLEQLEDFLEFINEGKIFCYRDYRGEKIYCAVSITDYSQNDVWSHVVNLTLTEVSFTETSMYTGSGFLKLVYLNGEYPLAGDTDLSGTDPDYEA